jgi:50S ribosomal protein L16 3-hydroxylase
VFLLQASGRRRWRIGRQKDLRLREGLPLKILADFHPEHEWVLEPGDMLYLPPRYAHDGVAEGECMTYSVGFRAPTGGDLARDVLLRLSESDDAEGEGAVYRDAGQWAVSAPGVIPDALIEFARREVEKRLARPELLTQALGEVLTEPKPGVWFDAGEAMDGPAAISLDRRTRMMYAHGYVFINGESYRASGHDAALMQGLADEREMAQALWRQLSPQAQALVNEWVQSGWAYPSS